jgi:hypothetical protein
MNTTQFKTTLAGLLYPYVSEPYSEFKMIEDTAVIDAKLINYLKNWSNEREFWNEIANKTKEELGSYFIPITEFEKVFKKHIKRYKLLSDLNKEFNLV